MKLDAKNVITQEITFQSSFSFGLGILRYVCFSKFKPQNPGFRLESLKKLIFYSFSIKKQQGAKITTPPNQMKVKLKKESLRMEQLRPILHGYPNLTHYCSGSQPFFAPWATESQTKFNGPINCQICSTGKPFHTFKKGYNKLLL